MAARRPLHRIAHPECPQGVKSWDACDRAVLEARGRCVALTEKEDECPNWAVAEFEERGYCGQHYASRVNAAMAATRAATRKAELDQRIEAYIAWTAEHPSILDRMPTTANTGPVSPVGLAGGAGLEPAITRVTAEGPTTERPAIGWRASSGTPFIRQVRLIRRALVGSLPSE